MESFKYKIMISLLGVALIPMFITIFIVKETMFEFKINDERDNRKKVASIASSALVEAIRGIEEKGIQAVFNIKNSAKKDRKKSIKWQFSNSLKDVYSVSLYNYSNKKTNLIFSESNPYIKSSKKIVKYIRKKNPIRFFTITPKINAGNRFLFASKLTSKKKNQVKTIEIMTIISKYAKSQYLVIDVKKDSLKALLMTISTFYSRILVLNPEGKVVLSSKINEDSKYFNPDNIISGAPFIEKTYPGKNADKIFAIYTVIPASNLGILLEFSSNDISTSDISLLQKKIFIISAFSVLLAFLFFMFIGKIKIEKDAKRNEYDITDSDLSFSLDESSMGGETSYPEIPEVANNTQPKSILNLSRTKEEDNKDEDTLSIKLDSKETDEFMINELENINSSPDEKVVEDDNKREVDSYLSSVYPELNDENKVESKGASANNEAQEIDSATFQENMSIPLGFTPEEDLKSSNPTIFPEINPPDEEIKPSNPTIFPEIPAQEGEEIESEGVSEEDTVFPEINPPGEEIKPSNPTIFPEIPAQEEEEVESEGVSKEDTVFPEINSSDEEIKPSNPTIFPEIPAQEEEQSESVAFAKEDTVFPEINSSDEEVKPSNPTIFPEIPSDSESLDVDDAFKLESDDNEDDLSIPELKMEDDDSKDDGKS